MCSGFRGVYFGESIVTKIMGGKKTRICYSAFLLFGSVILPRPCEEYLTQFTELLLSREEFVSSIFPPDLYLEK